MHKLLIYKLIYIITIMNLLIIYYVIIYITDWYAACNSVT